MTEHDQSDADLMAAVRLGDRAAFAELYHRFAPELLPLCQRILRSRDDAEDAVAEIFCEVWRRRDRYDPHRGAARTYLITLARSRSIDRLRSMAARPDMNDKSPATAALPAATAGTLPEDEAARAELRTRVIEVLGALTPRQREAMELAYYEGLSHQEIATRLAAPLGTVKTHIRQGLSKLRTAMRVRHTEEFE